MPDMIALDQDGLPARSVRVAIIVSHTKVTVTNAGKS